MGAFKKLVADLKSIVDETLDLFESACDLTISGDTYRLNFESGESVTIVATSNSADACKVGLHATIENLCEYELADLVERAARGGFNKIYIHLTKAA